MAASPFEAAFSAVDAAVDTAVEDDPFAHVAAADEPRPNDGEELLANARRVVESLEAALEQARAHERLLRERLGVRQR